MKTTLQIILTALVIVLMFWWGFERTVASRCAYYSNLGISDINLCGK